MSNATGGTSTAPNSTQHNPSTASSAGDRQTGPATPVRRVTSGVIERRPAVWLEAEQPSGDTSPTPPNADATPTAGAGGRKAKTRTSPELSGSSVKPVFDSDGRWVTPDDLMALVAQSNELSTRILNGEADIALARAYADVTKVIASLVRTEVERRRFVGGEPIKIR